MSWISDIINAIGYKLSENQKYEKWSQKQWDNWGSKLQPYYTIIDNYDWSPETKAILNKLFKSLPEDVSKMLLSYVISIYSKAGAAVSEGLIKQLLEIIKQFTF